jgi:hypothetical protein
MAGHRLKGRIGRITGVDPAGFNLSIHDLSLTIQLPCIIENDFKPDSSFSCAGPTFKFVSNEFRLDKSDAKFVDIVRPLEIKFTQVN